MKPLSLILPACLLMTALAHGEPNEGEEETSAVPSEPTTDAAGPDQAVGGPASSLEAAPFRAAPLKAYRPPHTAFPKRAPAAVNDEPADSVETPAAAALPAKSAAASNPVPTTNAAPSATPLPRGGNCTVLSHVDAGRHLDPDWAREYACLAMGMDRTGYAPALNADTRNPWRGGAPPSISFPVDCSDPSFASWDDFKKYGDKWWKATCGTFSMQEFKTMLDSRVSKAPDICKRPLSMSFHGDLLALCNAAPNWVSLYFALNTVTTTASEWVTPGVVKWVPRNCGVDGFDRQSVVANAIASCFNWGAGNYVYPGGDTRVNWIQRDGAVPPGTAQSDVDWLNKSLNVNKNGDQRCTNFDLAMNNCDFKNGTRVIKYDSSNGDYLKNWDTMVEKYAAR